MESPLILLAASVLILLTCWLQAASQLNTAAPLARAWQPPKPVMLPKVLGQLCSQSSGAEAHELAQLREANQRLTERLAAIELQQAVVSTRSQPPAAGGPTPAMSAIPSSTSIVTVARSWLSNASAVPRLREIWRMDPHRAGTRAALVEVHNDSWALLNTRQLARGVSSLGDPLQLRCLASKLLSGGAVKLSVVGGSVSFGTTFTTSKSKALFHWKVRLFCRPYLRPLPHRHPYLGRRRHPCQHQHW